MLTNLTRARERFFFTFGMWGREISKPKRPAFYNSAQLSPSFCQDLNAIHPWYERKGDSV